MSAIKNSPLNALTYPLTDGSITLPEALDFHNKHQPHHTLFTFKADGADELTNISFFEFRRAADRVAHVMRPQRQGPEGEVVAVVALSDALLYQAVAVGLMRAGMIPYLMSPRNTADAVMKMVKETGCHKVLSTQETLKPLISGITQLAEQDSYHLEVMEMPPLFAIFPCMGHESAEDTFEEYPTISSRPNIGETMLYLHSSGSTGMPKSVRQSFLTMCNWAAMPGLSELTDRTIACMALPAFHTIGFASQVIRGLYGLCKVALYPPVADAPSKLPVIPTPDNIIDHSQRTHCEEMMGVPAIYQVWALKEDTVQYLATLKLAAYAGGPLPSEIGRQLVDAGVPLTSVFGATEVGAPAHWVRHPCRSSEKEPYWEYLAFDEKLKVHFESQGDGTYELQFLRHETRHDLPVENMGAGVRGYATSDLWVPHSKEPTFWKLIGRKDDVILHSSGEKTVPGPMENIIGQNPWVTGVIMFGYKHDQPGVLIELAPNHAIDYRNEDEVIEARNALWPVIEKANKVAPGFSKLYKEFILFSDPQKPLPRAGKGTVMRKAALAQYHNEIEALYAMVSAIGGTEGISLPLSWTPGDISDWLAMQVKDVLPDLSFDPEKDLFDQGLDSLAATVLRRRIFVVLKSDPSLDSVSEGITQNTVYAYPTIRRLSDFISTIVHSPHTNGTKISSEIADRVNAIEDMITKYSGGLDAPLPHERSLPERHRVLITGSTGNIGSQLLEILLRDPRVETVYALNRTSAEGAQIKHTEKFADKGLDTNLLRAAKLIFFEGDLSDSHFGLSKDAYAEVQNNVTVIVHAAWRLDFNLSLGSFESNIRGTRHLIDLGRASPYGKHLRFVFTSSVSQALSWDTEKGPYPEEVLMDAQYALGMGYGESKYVGERIMSRCGLDTTSLRIGQVTGDVPSGAWATTDWVPIMIKSGIALGALPSQTGAASWIPIHAVTEAILDISFNASLESPRAINMVHPEPIAFDSLMSYINEALVSTGVVAELLPVIPQTQWQQHLEKRALNASQRDVERIPAIKLLEFFRATTQADSAARLGSLKGVDNGGITHFSTAKVMKASTTMLHLPPLGKDHALSWVKYWHSRGFFDAKV